MELFVPSETHTGETRVAATPDSVKKLTALGLAVKVQSGAGEKADFLDSDYQDAGAEVITDRGAALAAADIVLRVRSPEEGEIGTMKEGALHVSFLDAFTNKELPGKFAAARVNAVSMEMIPRSTLAQKMDALSSQANLAGYRAVLTAATELGTILPMMMTPAGTLSPARFFVIGVGVAGLQAIATAKRLGARVDAFDTRPVVEEQVKSLGAKFVKIDLGETGQTAQGYAKELTPEQIEKQREGMAKVCAQSDAVITTAKLFGRPAPTLVTAQMLDTMKPGSVVIDLAVESGGNVEGSKPGEVVTRSNGVHIVGYSPLECLLARDASQMYASNLYSLLEHFFDKEAGRIAYREDDDILKGCLLTKDGTVVHERFREGA